MKINLFSVNLIMPKSTKKKPVKKTGPSKGLSYFSARSLERAVSKGTKDVSKIAIDLVGYTVVEMKGWVVKEFEDGSYEKISKIEKFTTSHFVLD
jgi:hypothetical protein